MKKLGVLITFFLIVNLSYSQSSAQDVYYAQQLAKAQQLLNEGKYEESRAALRFYMEAFPENLYANLLYSFNQINLKAWESAKASLEAGLQIDPTFYGLYLCSAYLNAAQDNVDKAREALQFAIQYGPEKTDMAATRKEFEAVGRNIGKAETLQNLFSWYEQNFSTLKRLPSLDRDWATLSALSADPAKLKQEASRLAEAYGQSGRHDVALANFYNGSVVLQNSGYPSEALEVAEAGYAYYKKNGYSGNNFQASRLLSHLMDLNAKKLDYDNALSYESDAAKHREVFGKERNRNLPSYHIQSLVLSAIATADSAKGNPDENQKKAREIALASFGNANNAAYSYGMALAANAIVITHDDGQNAYTGIEYGERGLEIARILNLDIKETIASNMAFCYYGLGTAEGKQKAYDLYRKQAEKMLAAGNWEAAASDINNLGMLLMYSENWEQAAALFEEVVKLEGYGPKYTNYRDRLSFYKRQVSAYQNLIRCYAHMGNAEKAFQAMEASRSRVLLERLGNSSIKNVSLIDLQTLLKPDEAVIMYSVTQGHEIIILTVSKKYAQVLAFEDPRFIGEIKDIRAKALAKNLPPPEPPKRETANLNKFVMTTLRSQVNVARDNYDKVAMAPKKDMDAAYKTLNNWMTNPYIFQNETSVTNMQDFLYRVQKYLLMPINNRLSGIKNLIIAPDDIFNFIPFEALRSFDEKYMVEKYNFRYIHSASVLLALQQRQYSESRKPLLAMGGATYEVPEVERLPSGTDAELNLLETEAYENIKAGKSQRRVYASLGRTNWDYLKGSVDEVKNIAKAMPGAETFMGNDMTENRIKEMSKSGQLKNYKVLHLATHGFVEERIPDLSGLVMTLTKQEQGGEDGFLNTSEIAGLQLNTDLTVLSACETARGQLFAGEGVTGITQSLILAGNNAALVSLWTVDDAATMNFMSSFYKEVAKGKPYAQVVNELKKKFIKGDFGKEYTHPRFWAPFIYYGN